MARDKDIRVNINADNKKLKKGLKDSQRHINNFGKSVKKIGGIIAAAFAVQKITKFASETMKLYDVQAKAEQSLLVALKGRKSAQQNLIRQAQELQKVTLFGDEETIQAQALIAAFVKEEKHIKKIIPLVQDLATAKGMQLNVAADLVAKTLGSSTNALSRYGIQVEGAVGSTERLESLVNGLSKAFEGQAKAAAKVGTGPLQILKNQWSDIKEGIGEGLAPIVTKVFDVIIRGAKKAVKLFSKGKIKIAEYTNEWIRLYNKSQFFRINVEFIALILKSLFSTGKIVIQFLINGFAALGKTVGYVFNPKNWKKGFLAGLETTLNDANQVTLQKIKITATDLGKAWKDSIARAAKGEIELIDIDALRKQGKKAGKAIEAIERGTAETLPSISGKSGVISQDLTNNVELALNKNVEPALKKAAENAGNVLGEAAGSKLNQVAYGLANAFRSLQEGDMKGALGGIFGSLSMFLPPPLNMIAQLLGQMIPSFAQGGEVRGPTLAMIGDNPGKREMIVPSEMYGKMGGTLSTKLMDDHILITYNRANDRRNKLT